MGIAGTNTSLLFSAVGFSDINDSTGDFKAGDLYDLLFGISGAITLFGALSGIIIGLFATGKVLEAVIGAFVGFLSGWVVADLNTIRNSIISSLVGTEFSYIGTLVNIFIIIFAVAFVLSMIEFWRGAD
jgi:hypothetical protein